MKNVDYDLTYALNSEGKLVNIEQAESGKKCNCICPACQKSLVAKKGKKRKHHFAHSSGKNCKHAIESMLHHLAKDKFQEAFYKNEEFIIQYEHKSYCSKKKECKYIPFEDCSTKTITRPFNLKDYYDTCEQEKCYDNISCRSDLKIYSTKNPSHKPIYLEFCVTHASDSEKLHSGNKIIEILIESEKDIFDIIEKGIVETKSDNEEEFNKIVFYGFKNEDYKNENISSEIDFFRFTLYKSGKMFCSSDSCFCNKLLKPRNNSLVDLCFHLPSCIPITDDIYTTMKCLCYKKYGILNCSLCINYVESYSEPAMMCKCYLKLQLPYEEKYNLNTARAIQCPYFRLQEKTLSKILQEGMSGLDKKILNFYRKEEYYITNLVKSKDIKRQLKENEN